MTSLLCEKPLAARAATAGCLEEQAKQRNAAAAASSSIRPADSAAAAAFSLVAAVDFVFVDFL